MNDKYAPLNALAVELTIGCWTAKKHDKNASRELKNTKNAVADDAVRAHKNLLAGTDKLKLINDYVGNKRNEYYRMTLPWSDLGQRIVPAPAFADFMQWSRETENEFWKLVDEFVVEYPNLISAQAFQLGALFNRAEYPSADEIRSKFKYGLVVAPLPTAGDFRIDAPKELMEMLEKSFEQQAQARIEAANRELWDRLYETLRHASDRLGYDENGKKKVFRDSLVENAVELCGLLKTLNVTNDDKLERAREQLESVMLGVSAEELRDDGMRTIVKKQIDTIMEAWF